MKKTISVTLAGIIFNIEEDGYVRLKEYLDSIKNYFSSSQDKDEIIGDIESRAAEIFSERVSSAKQAITMSDVEAFVGSMGTVEDIAGMEKTESPKAASKGASWSDKKFYRDPDGAIIMGVASGIANYFGIDPVIVRLIFVASLFFGGAGVIIYLVLCLIMPEAKTTAQKMEMRGQPVNLASLKDAAEENISLAKKRIVFGQPIRKTVIMLGEMVKKIGMFISIILGIAIIFWSLVAIIGIFFAFGNLLFNAGSTYIDFPARDLLPGMNYVFAVSAGFLTALIPAIFGIMVGFSLIKRRMVMNLVAGLMLLSVWIISLTAFGVYIVRVMPIIEERERAAIQAEETTKNFEFRDFHSIRAGGNYELKVVRGDDFKVEATGTEYDLSATDINLTGDELRIEEGRRDRICVFCFNDSHKRTVSITMPELVVISTDGIVSSEVHGFSGEKMTLRTNGASKMTADANVQDVMAKIDGVSKLTLLGQGENLTINANGAASVDASRFGTRTAKIEADGTSRVNVSAAEKIDVRADGASKIFHSGDPAISKKMDGASRLQKSD